MGGIPTIKHWLVYDIAIPTLAEIPGDQGRQNVAILRESADGPPCQFCHAREGRPKGPKGQFLFAQKLDEMVASLLLEYNISHQN